MRRAARISLTTLLVAAVVGGLPAASPAGASAPALTVTAASPTSLRVGWTSTAQPASWWVIVTGADDRSVGQRTACGTCRSVTVDHLAPASRYFVRIVDVAGSGEFGTFSAPVAASTPAASGCAGVGTSTCVLVDATRKLGAATGVGTGSLHSITAGTDPARVQALRPSAWRVSALDLDKARLARQYGGSLTLILSDPWMVATASASPWLTWDLYRWWVGAVVDIQVANGLVPDYWEIQNEPQLSAYAGGAPTAELIAQQYAVAAQVIRQKLPGAKVLGPSSGYVTFGSGLLPLDGFLGAIARAGTAVDAVAWHEIGAGCLGYCDGSPRAVLQHADDARSALGAKATSTPLVVNEWGAPWNASQPGAVVGYLSSLAYAGVSVANPACWGTSCGAQPGTLDGLLMPDGSTPTDAWFAHQAYAAMTGDGRTLVDSTVADPEASVISTVDGGGTVRILLGRHTGCQTGVDDSCPGLAYAPSKTEQVLVRSGTVKRYRASVQRIASVAGASSGPVTLTAGQLVSPSRGVLNVGSYALGDGEALVVTLVPA